MPNHRDNNENNHFIPISPFAAVPIVSRAAKWGFIRSDSPELPVPSPGPVGGSLSEGALLDPPHFFS